jgi:hypothetical protein
MQTANRTAAPPIMLVIALLIPIAIRSEDSSTKVDPRAYLAEISRLGARKPFLTDSPDMYLEPASLNQFFTEAIYRKLQGNAYFGYRYDEGFIFDGTEVQIEILKDLTSGAGCAAAYRLAIKKALDAAGLEIKTKASCQIGICIVGIEESETTKTIPGVMVETYLRNAQLKKSLFIRYGAGSLRGLASAIRLSAEMLVSELQARRKIREQPR